MTIINALSNEEVLAAIQKFGWTSQQAASCIEVKNRNKKSVAFIYPSKKGYVIKDSAGMKLLSGNGQLGKGITTVATEYFYAVEKV